MVVLLIAVSLILLTVQHVLLALSERFSVTLHILDSLVDCALGEAHSLDNFLHKEDSRESVLDFHDLDTSIVARLLNTLQVHRRCNIELLLEVLPVVVLELERNKSQF